MECNQIILDQLHHVPLFEALDQSQLEKIITHSSIVNLPGRTVLFERGQEAEHFYLVKKGQVKLYCISQDGNEKVMEILYPKQTFAEAVMFMPQHVYPVCAETIVDSELISFSMKVYQSILKESQESCFRLLGIMSRHLHSMVQDIDSLTLHNATYRLIVYLLGELPDEAQALSSIHLSTPKNIIASRLSIKPETFSRILLQMSKDGLVQVHDNDITLLNVQGLRARL